MSNGQAAHLTLDAVIEALWDWDPIGVADAREQASSQYDGIARRLLSALSRSDGLDAAERCIRDYIEDLGVTGYGVDGFLNWLRSVA